MATTRGKSKAKGITLEDPLPQPARRRNALPATAPNSLGQHAPHLGTQHAQNDIAARVVNVTAPVVNIYTQGADINHPDKPDDEPIPPQDNRPHPPEGHGPEVPDFQDRLPPCPPLASSIAQRPVPNIDFPGESQFFHLPNGKRILNPLRPGTERHIIPRKQDFVSVNPAQWEGVAKPYNFSAQDWPPNRDVLPETLLTCTGLDVDNQAIRCLGDQCWVSTEALGPTEGPAEANNKEVCDSNYPPDPDDELRETPCDHTYSEWYESASQWEEHLEIRNTGTARGNGVFTKRRWDTDTVLGIYTGQLIPQGTQTINDYCAEFPVGPELKHPADSTAGSGKKVSRNRTTDHVLKGLIDAEEAGNWTRFINHDCRPNTHFNLFRIGSTLVMAIRTIKNIDIPEGGSGPEITISYGKEYKNLFPDGICICTSCEENRQNAQEEQSGRTGSDKSSKRTNPKVSKDKVKKSKELPSRKSRTTRSRRNAAAPRENVGTTTMPTADTGAMDDPNASRKGGVEDDTYVPSPPRKAGGRKGGKLPKNSKAQMEKVKGGRVTKKQKTQTTSNIQKELAEMSAQKAGTSMDWEPDASHDPFNLDSRSQEHDDDDFQDDHEFDNY